MVLIRLSAGRHLSYRLVRLDFVVRGGKIVRFAAMA
jgi:hypothetical protein